MNSNSVFVKSSIQSETKRKNYTGYDNKQGYCNELAPATCLFKKWIAIFTDLKVVVTVFVRNGESAAVPVAVAPLTPSLASILEHALVDGEILAARQTTLCSHLESRLHPKGRLLATHR